MCTHALLSPVLQPAVTVAWVVVVLDYIFDLPVTSGAVGVLEGTTIWSALRLRAVQLPYQAVIQPDRMLSIVHL